MWRAARTALALITFGLLLGACGTRGATTSSSTGASAGASSAAKGAALKVSPASGGPTTTFALTFTAPDTSQVLNGARTGYTVSVTGAGSAGCLGQRSVQAGAATGGQLVSVALDPAQLGGTWCPGAHTVRVIEVQSPVCKPGTLCPQHVRVIATVGAGTFTIGG